MLKVNNLKSFQTIENFNDLRLFEVEEMKGNAGKIFVIKRVKISKDDTIERIQTIIKKLDEGKIWRKTGSLKKGTVKYAGKGLNPNEIECIKVKKTAKTEENEPEFSWDVTIENVADKVEEMNEDDTSALKGIKKDLEDTFGKNIETQSFSRSGSSIKQTSAKEKAVISEQKKSQMAVHLQVMKKEKAVAKEEANEENRVQKRKNSKLAEELDKKSDKRRSLDIRSDEKQAEIVRKDRKKLSKE